MNAIHVLSVGNSFSQDAQFYLHDLARSEDCKIETVNLMIGGCSLERHFRNFKGDKKEYTLEVNGHTCSGFLVSIKDALLARSWNYITLQQASYLSFDEESYEPYLKELAAYVRELCPKAKLLIHQTWAYETNSDLIEAQGFETYTQMFEKIRHCYEKAALDIHADGVIPSGAAFKKALELGISSVHRDGLHAKLGVGRFILALVWYKYLTGNTIGQITFQDFKEHVDEREYALAIETVNQIF